MPNSNCTGLKGSELSAARDVAVLQAIQNEGLATIPNLMKKTGLPRRRLYTVISRLEQQGKVKFGMKMTDARIRLIEAVESPDTNND